MENDFKEIYLTETVKIVNTLDKKSIDDLILLLVNTKKNEGRLFILGVGGSAANASHAVNDFRKIVGIEAHAPTDNVSELTARTNDEGWHTVFVEWLKVSRLNSKDCVLIFSVGGGDEQKNVSPNLVKALQYAKEVGSKIAGIVGPNGGHTASVADACVKIPVTEPGLITPLSESFQALVWHLVVSDPRLKSAQTKWESLAK
jgi:D-sedoheptulose 7-phosphate isomerase